MKVTKRIDEVFGVLCKDFKYMVYLGEGGFYILDIENLHLTMGGLECEDIEKIKTNIIFTNNIKLHPDKYKTEQIGFDYDEFLNLIRNEYGSAIDHNGVVSNTVYTPSEILKLLCIHSTLVLEDGMTLKLNKLDMDSIYYASSLYLFCKSNTVSNIDYSTIEIIRYCLDSLNLTEYTTI